MGEVSIAVARGNAMRWILLMLGDWEGFVREFVVADSAGDGMNTNDGPAMPPVGG